MAPKRKSVIRSSDIDSDSSLDGGPHDDVTLREIPPAKRVKADPQAHKIKSPKKENKKSTKTSTGKAPASKANTGKASASSSRPLAQNNAPNNASASSTTPLGRVGPLKAYRSQKTSLDGPAPKAKTNLKSIPNVLVFDKLGAKPLSLLVGLHPTLQAAYDLDVAKMVQKSIKGLNAKGLAMELDQDIPDFDPSSEGNLEEAQFHPSDGSQMSEARAPSGAYSDD